MKKNNKIMFTRKYLEHLDAFHLFGKLRVLVSSDEVDIEEFDFMGSESDCVAYAVGKGLKHNVDIFINGKPANLEEELEKRSKTIAQNGNEGTHYDNNTQQDKVLARKNTPIYSGVVAYFPLALKEIAKASFVGQEQHNPDKPLAWDRSKSGDELDAMLRHLVDHASGEEFDDCGTRHIVKCGWRILAYIQKTLEGE